MVEVPRLAASPLGRSGDVQPTDRVVVTEHSMTNGLIAVAWDLDGDDHLDHRRRARPRAAAGRQRGSPLELAPDHPVEYDAWDLESWTRSLGAPITAAPSRSSSTLRIRCWPSCVVRREFGQSSS